MQPEQTLDLINKVEEKKKYDLFITRVAGVFVCFHPGGGCLTLPLITAVSVVLFHAKVKVALMFFVVQFYFM